MITPFPPTPPTPEVDLSYKYSYSQAYSQSQSHNQNHGYGQNYSHRNSQAQSPYYPMLSPQSVYWYYPYPMGHAPASEIMHNEKRYAQLQYDLRPLLGGNDSMRVLAALQILDELIMPCAILFEQQALVRWLRHLQDVIVAIKLYAFVVPLTHEEKKLLKTFGSYWTQKRGGPCCMGRPEAQLVLSTLMEMSYH